jgi:hypothetical protein
VRRQVDMASWSATARVSAALSKRSAATNVTPVLRWTGAALCANAVTECPRDSSRGTTRRPITPVAPVTKMRMLSVPIDRDRAASAGVPPRKPCRRTRGVRHATVRGRRLADETSETNQLSRRSTGATAHA